MTNVIKLKKGLDINLKGKPNPIVTEAEKSEVYALIPDDFHGIIPKVTVKPGDRVEAGTPLMYSKKSPDVKFVSPVSGEVIAVNRGERRKVLSVTVKPDAKISYVDFGKHLLSSLSADQVRIKLLESGMFAFIKQRPYDILADPSVMPRDIFITAFDSAPLAPDFNLIVKGQESDFQAGIDALSKLTNGKVYVSFRSGCEIPIKGAESVSFSGPHPCGNAGVQIHHIAPVCKGHVVWTVNAFDLLFIGRLFNKGIADFSRTVAVTGSEIREPSYKKTILGARIDSIVGNNVLKANYHQRYISGNVLTGTKITSGDFLRAPHNQITVIPEGDDCHELFGWALPGTDKYSMSRSYFTWLIGRKKEYTLDARLHGGERAIIMSGEYDRVLPMDILPEFLIKSTLAFDVDKMENLGIYEVAPEDFALCEFVDTSKLEIQKIMREGLDQLMKEMN